MHEKALKTGHRKQDILIRIYAGSAKQAYATGRKKQNTVYQTGRMKQGTRNQGILNRTYLTGHTIHDLPNRTYETGHTKQDLRNWAYETGHAIQDKQDIRK